MAAKTPPNVFGDLEMKKLLILLFMCITMTVRAATVWWVHSFSENAVVYDKIGTYSITEYAENVLGDSLYNVAYMIKDVNNDLYLDFEYPGLTEPDDYTINWAEGTGDGYPYIRNNQVSIGEDNNLPDELRVELHLYDENNDSFVRFAVSDIFNITDIQRALYGQGTIYPEADVPTEFISFYTDDYVPPVPEPSIQILTMLGIYAILMRRRNG